jgi:hypothetical protein
MRIAGLAVLVVGVGACLAKAPPSTVEETCGKACQSRARCSETECTRGCNLTIDRIAEREEDRVIDCVARAGSCVDATWAHCATWLGPHADGGPPAPPPPGDEME